jgi:hypothetical protein
MGRAVPFEATVAERDLVKMCASVGVSQEQMALMIKRPDAAGIGKPISVDTLTRHFADELASGKAQTVVLIAGRLVRTALGQNTKAGPRDELSAQMFYLQTPAGWRETVGIDLPPPGDSEDGPDLIAIAARIAGLVEKGRRKALQIAGPKTVQ